MNHSSTNLCIRNFPCGKIMNTVFETHLSDFVVCSNELFKLMHEIEIRIKTCLEKCIPYF